MAGGSDGRSLNGTAACQPEADASDNTRKFLVFIDIF